MPGRIISASLSPNTERDDYLTAWGMLFRPNLWRKGNATDSVQRWFREKFGVRTVCTFSSGRVALLALLESFGIGGGDEVVLQAFTCVAVPNSIRWSGAVPVYADTDETLNLSVTSFGSVITDRTKAVIIQHTFGNPADIRGITALAKKHGILVIEDCAHALGAEYDGKPLGSFGDAAFFSFGRDKALSSVWGGAAIVRKTDTHPLAEARFKKYHANLPYPEPGWIVRQLLHPVAFSVILPLYRIGAGKVLLVTLQKLGILSVPVYPEEKEGGRPRELMTKYPNGLAVLLLKQLRKLPKFVRQRKAAAERYDRQLAGLSGIVPVSVRAGAVLLRYPARVGKPADVIGQAKRMGILIGNWYHETIDPKGVNLTRAGYRTGSCPDAEEASGHIINLPTRITEPESDRVVRAIRRVLV